MKFNPFKTTVLTFTILYLCVMGGCVYYNTFYHAEKYYKDGLKEIEKSDGRVSRKAEENFQKTIEKCTKVLTSYRTSSYLDDALLLMGMAFYQKGDYEEAIKSFDKLVVQYSDSDKKPEALYWMAKAEYQEGLYPEFLMTIEQIDQNAVGADWLDELNFLRGETYYSMENYLSSFEEFKKLLDRRSSSRWRDEGILRMAQCQFYLKNYDEALENFQVLIETASTLSLKREGYFWIASSFSEIGHHQDAAEAYRELLGWDLSEEEGVRARTGLGRQLVFLGEIDEALEVFQLITFDYGKTPEAAEANYLRGQLYLEDLADTEKAGEEFKKGYRQAPNSEYGKKCEEKWEEIERWENLREFVGKEIAASQVDLPQAYYLMAEFHFYQLKKTEEALLGFQTVVDSFPDSPWAPKATYAIAWLLEEELGDTLSSKREYEKLIELFPETRYADYARLKLDMDLPDRPIGFYIDEMEGQLLSAVQVERDIMLDYDEEVSDSVPDTTSSTPPDSLPDDE
jgi:TolA-binding protein